ncbi:MAG: sigma-54-dependent Fis family transcriptional regulator [Hydrogenophilus sp.]|nr:sigma-54-dependent Fis family transcriptional regulator [Hydrogenophilus sp.]
MSSTPNELTALISWLEFQEEPHIIIDREYRIVAANPAMRILMGEAIQSKRFCFQLSHHYDLPCDRVGESCPLQTALISGHKERAVHCHQTAQGERYVSLELTPVRDSSGAIRWFVEKQTILPFDRHGEKKTPQLIGRSPAFKRLLTLIDRVAPSNAAVLLHGESGTGKELIAAAIHQASRRANKPFVTLDCSGLPEPLFESELFGHERGAFTGATHRKIGLVEAANGGTLFLDELGDIPLSMQVKLLRLLETGTFRRLGSTELLHTDIRLISATHQPLVQMVAEGRFRQDLYYRINTFPIPVPPLRERTGDIPLLANLFLTRIAPDTTVTIDPEAMAILEAYPYPGNVRELRNILERSFLMSDGRTIRIDDLPEEVRAAARIPPHPSSPSPLPFRSGWQHQMVQLENSNLLKLVHQFPGSRKDLAAHLGISERTLYRRLSALGLLSPKRRR